MLSHVHTSQQLARGIANDVVVDLLTWLHQRICPYESNMTEEDSYIFTSLHSFRLLALLKRAGSMLQELLGVRACLDQSVMDAGEGLPAEWAKRTANECIQSQTDLYEQHNNTADSHIRVWFGLRQIMNSTDLLLTQTRDAAKKLATGIHMRYLMRIHWWSRDKEWMTGLLPTLRKSIYLTTIYRQLIQWVNEHEIGLLSKSGVKVSHCPAAAMHMLDCAPIREIDQMQAFVST